MFNKSPKQHSATNFRLMMLFFALLPFVAIPLLGSLFYFRHDDSAILLWAKEFTQPLYNVFSTNPEVNGFANYPGMGVYWRPFSYLYVKGLWHLFGTNPAPYYVVGGLTFILAVYFLFRLMEQRTGLFAAVLSCLALFVAFQGTMYNLFHVIVPVSFFYQLGMVYLFWSYLRNPQWYYYVGTLLFLVPAMGRQTTPVLLTAIFLTVLIENEWRQKVLSLKNFSVLGILFAGFYIITFSPQTSHGSVLSVLPDYSQSIKFISDRFYYYGTILTSNITGIFMFLILGGGVLQHLTRIVECRCKFDKGDWIWPPLALILTFVFMRLQPFGIYWLVFCFLYLFIFDTELRMPIGWASASLLSFLAAQYYHNGYLLEAAFPIAMVFGILLARFVKSVAPALQEYIYVHFNKIALYAMSGIFVLIPFIIYLGGKLPVLSDKIELVKITIDANQNFSQLMKYLHFELPKNTIIYEFSEKELGTTRFDRRFLPLKERALRIKIMSIEDKLVMLKVLDRGDVKILPSSQLVDTNLKNENYFIALNNFEREIATTHFELTVIKEFKGSYDSAAIYSYVNSVKESH